MNFFKRQKQNLCCTICHILTSRSSKRRSVRASNWRGSHADVAIAAVARETDALAFVSVSISKKNDPMASTRLVGRLKTVACH